RWMPERRPATLGAQDRQRPQQTAEEPATESQPDAAGILHGRDQEGRGLRPLRRDLARQLAVKPQEVIPGQTESADRWLACEANMRPVPVVAMEPSGQRGMSLL